MTDYGPAIVKARLDRVIPAVAGDFVPRGIWRDDMPVVVAHKNEEYVKPKCDEESVDFICISCKHYLKNIAQLDFHTENGRHLIARVCLLHGAEEP